MFQEIGEIIFIILLVSIFVSFQSYAGDFSPTGKLISLGQSKSYVIATCGVPTFSSSYVMYSDPQDLTSMIVCEELIYDYGPTRFVKVYKFENQILVSITSPGYGSSQAIRRIN